MNLIDDPWIPVSTRSGRRLRIPPWQLTEGIHDDPIVMVAAPRPDFSGALLELLIGLLQTEAAPGEWRDWARWKEQPPTPEELKDRLTSAAPCFELFGNGPRFMQSLDHFDGRKKDIADLVVDDPPSEMIKKNKDLFIKRGRIRALCQPCTAAALYAANAFSPAAGRGHRTSLRGGGPVTTLVSADPAIEAQQATLWHNAWLNVMPRRAFEEIVPGNRSLHEADATYPWLAPTRTSENGEVTTPEDMSPFHVFWGMPRRIRLNDPAAGNGNCSVCQHQGSVVTGFVLRHGGMNYEGAWIHPLTPYSFDETGSPAPAHMPRGGIGYRHWPAIATGQQNARIRREPAVTVKNALYLSRGPMRKMVVAACGYDVDNAKIRGWYEHRAPAYRFDAQRASALRELASDMIVAAGEVAGNLRSAMKEAWKTAKSPEFTVDSFWQATEPEFLGSLDKLVQVLGDDAMEVEILHQWHTVLRNASERLFETWAEAGEIGQCDPGRIARAHLALSRFNWKRKIRDALRLPETTRNQKRGSS